MAYVPVLKIIFCLFSLSLPYFVFYCYLSSLVLRPSLHLIFSPHLILCELARDETLSPALSPWFTLRLTSNWIGWRALERLLILFAWVKGEARKKKINGRGA